MAAAAERPTPDLEEDRPVDGDDLIALRRRLYRPNATDEDRRRYERELTRSAAAAVAAQPAPPARSRRWSPDRARGPAAAVAALLVLVVGSLIARATTEPWPIVSAQRIELLGGPAQQAGARADLALLFGRRDPFLGLYLAQHRTTLSASLRSDSVAIDGRGTGPTTVSLAGIASPGQATGLMTVLFACDRPGTAWSWVVEGPPDADGRPVRTGARGGDCGSGITTATFVPRPHHVPSQIRIAVPAGVRSIVEVDLSAY